MTTPIAVHTITQREAGRLVRAYTARQMAEHLGQCSTLDQVLAGHRRRRERLSLVELRNLLFAFEDEVKKLERRARDENGKAATSAAAAGVGE